MEQLYQTQTLKVTLSLDDDDENTHPNVQMAGIKRAFTMPVSQSKRRVISEPKKGGFIAAKMKERQQLHKAYGAIRQSEVIIA